ncbi:hypothetical protein D3C79_705440 [compost metagenome]
MLDGVDVAVIHLLAGNGGDRLRRLARRQGQAGGAAGAFDRVTQLAGFVGRQQGAVFDLRGVQLQGLAVGSHRATADGHGNEQGQRFEARAASADGGEGVRGALGVHLGRLRICR